MSLPPRVLPPPQRLRDAAASPAPGGSLRLEAPASGFSPMVAFSPDHGAPMLVPVRVAATPSQSSYGPGATSRPPVPLRSISNLALTRGSLSPLPDSPVHTPQGFTVDMETLQSSMLASQQTFQNRMRTWSWASPDHAPATAVENEIHTLMEYTDDKLAAKVAAGGHASKRLHTLRAAVEQLLQKFGDLASTAFDPVFSRDEGLAEGESDRDGDGDGEGAAPLSTLTHAREEAESELAASALTVARQGENPSAAEGPFGLSQRASPQMTHYYNKIKPFGSEHPQQCRSSDARPPTASTLRQYGSDENREHSYGDRVPAPFSPKEPSAEGSFPEGSDNALPKRVVSFEDGSGLSEFQVFTLAFDSCVDYLRKVPALLNAGQHVQSQFRPLLVSGSFAPSPGSHTADPAPTAGLAPPPDTPISTHSELDQYMQRIGATLTRIKDYFVSRVVREPTIVSALRDATRLLDARVSSVERDLGAAVSERDDARQSLAALREAHILTSDRADRFTHQCRALQADKEKLLALLEELNDAHHRVQGELAATAGALAEERTRHKRLMVAATRLREMAERAGARAMDAERKASVEERRRQEQEQMRMALSSELIALRVEHAKLGQRAAAEREVLQQRVNELAAGGAALEARLASGFLLGGVDSGDPQALRQTEVVLEGASRLGAYPKLAARVLLRLCTEDARRPLQDAGIDREGVTALLWLLMAGRSVASVEEFLSALRGEYSQAVRTASAAAQTTDSYMQSRLEAQKLNSRAAKAVASMLHDQDVAQQRLRINRRLPAQASQVPQVSLQQYSYDMQKTAYGYADEQSSEQSAATSSEGRAATDDEQESASGALADPGAESTSGPAHSSPLRSKHARAAVHRVMAHEADSSVERGGRPGEGRKAHSKRLKPHHEKQQHKAAHAKRPEPGHGLQVVEASYDESVVESAVGSMAEEASETLVVQHHDPGSTALQPLQEHDGQDSDGTQRGSSGSKALRLQQKISGNLEDLRTFLSPGANQNTMDDFCERVTALAQHPELEKTLLKITDDLKYALLFSRKASAQSAFGINVLPSVDPEATPADASVRSLPFPTLRAEENHVVEEQLSETQTDKLNNITNAVVGKAVAGLTKMVSMVQESAILQRPRLAIDTISIEAASEYEVSGSEPSVSQVGPLVAALHDVAQDSVLDDNHLANVLRDSSLTLASALEAHEALHPALGGKEPLVPPGSSPISSDGKYEDTQNDLKAGQGAGPGRECLLQQEQHQQKLSRERPLTVASDDTADNFSHATSFDELATYDTEPPSVKQHRAPTTTPEMGKVRFRSDGTASQPIDAIALQAELEASSNQDTPDAHCSENDATSGAPLSNENESETLIDASGIWKRSAKSKIESSFERTKRITRLQKNAPNYAEIAARLSNQDSDGFSQVLHSKQPRTDYSGLPIDECSEDLSAKAQDDSTLEYIRSIIEHSVPLVNGDGRLVDERGVLLTSNTKFCLFMSKNNRLKRVPRDMMLKHIARNALVQYLPEADRFIQPSRTRQSDGSAPSESPATVTRLRSERTPQSIPTRVRSPADGHRQVDRITDKAIVLQTQANSLIRCGLASADVALQTEPLVLDDLIASKEALIRNYPDTIARLLVEQRSPLTATDEEAAHSDSALTAAVDAIVTDTFGPATPLQQGSLSLDGHALHTNVHVDGPQTVASREKQLQGLLAFAGPQSPLSKKLARVLAEQSNTGSSNIPESLIHAETVTGTVHHHGRPPSSAASDRPSFDSLRAAAHRVEVQYDSLTQHFLGDSMYSRSARVRPVSATNIPVHSLSSDPGQQPPEPPESDDLVLSISDVTSTSRRPTSQPSSTPLARPPAATRERSRHSPELLVTPNIYERALWGARFPLPLSSDPDHTWLGPHTGQQPSTGGLFTYNKTLVTYDSSASKRVSVPFSRSPHRAHVASQLSDLKVASQATYLPLRQPQSGPRDSPGYITRDPQLRRHILSFDEYRSGVLSPETVSSALHTGNFQPSLRIHPRAGANSYFTAVEGPLAIPAPWRVHITTSADSRQRQMLLRLPCGDAIAYAPCCVGTYIDAKRDFLPGSTMQMNADTLYRSMIDAGAVSPNARSHPSVAPHEAAPSVAPVRVRGVYTTRSLCARVGDSIAFIRLSSVCLALREATDADTYRLPSIFALLDSVVGSPVSVFNIALGDSQVSYIRIPLRQAVLRSLLWTRKFIALILAERLRTRESYIALVADDRMFATEVADRGVHAHCSDDHGLGIMPAVDNPETSRAYHFDVVPGDINRAEAETLAAFVVFFCKRRYGIKSIVASLIWSLLASICYHQYEHEDIYLFARLFFGDLDPDFFLTFLDVMRVAGEQRAPEAPQARAWESPLCANVDMEAIPYITKSIFQSWDSSRLSALCESIYAARLSDPTMQLVSLAQIILTAYGASRKAVYRTLMLIWNKHCSDGSMSEGGFRQFVSICLPQWAFATTTEVLYVFGAQAAAQASGDTEDAYAKHLSTAAGACSMQTMRLSEAGFTDLFVSFCLGRYATVSLTALRQALEGTSMSTAIAESRRVFGSLEAVAADAIVGVVRNTPDVREACQRVQTLLSVIGCDLDAFDMPQSLEKMRAVLHLLTDKVMNARDTLGLATLSSGVAVVSHHLRESR